MVKDEEKSAGVFLLYSAFLLELLFCHKLFAWYNEQRNTITDNSQLRSMQGNVSFLSYVRLKLQVIGIFM